MYIDNLNFYSSDNNYTDITLIEISLSLNEQTAFNIFFSFIIFDSNFLVTQNHKSSSQFTCSNRVKWNRTQYISFVKQWVECARVLVIFLSAPANLFLVRFLTNVILPSPMNIEIYEWRIGYAKVTVIILIETFISIFIVFEFRDTTATS